jgi:hypothetical protein
MSPTVMRVPRTHGLPKRTAGSLVMRSRGFMLSVYGSFTTRAMEAQSPTPGGGQAPDDGQRQNCHHRRSFGPTARAIMIEM